MNLASKAFSHYWKKYSSEKELEFNSLRKRYINEIDIKYGSRGKIITHRSHRRIDKQTLQGCNGNY